MSKKFGLFSVWMFFFVGAVVLFFFVFVELEFKYAFFVTLEMV